MRSLAPALTLLLFGLPAVAQEPASLDSLDRQLAGLEASLAAIQAEVQTLGTTATPVAGTVALAAVRPQEPGAEARTAYGRAWAPPVGLSATASPCQAAAPTGDLPEAAGPSCADLERQLDQAELELAAIQVSLVSLDRAPRGGDECKEKASGCDKTRATAAAGGECKEKASGCDKTRATAGRECKEKASGCDKTRATAGRECKEKASGCDKTRATAAAGKECQERASRCDKASAAAGRECKEKASGCDKTRATAAAGKECQEKASGCDKTRATAAAGMQCQEKAGGCDKARAATVTGMECKGGEGDGCQKGPAGAELELRVRLQACEQEEQEESGCEQRRTRTLFLGGEDRNGGHPAIRILELQSEDVDEAGQGSACQEREAGRRVMAMIRLGASGEDEESFQEVLEERLPMALEHLAGVEAEILEEAIRDGVVEGLQLALEPGRMHQEIRVLRSGHGDRDCCAEGCRDSRGQGRGQGQDHGRMRDMGPGGPGGPHGMMLHREHGPRGPEEGFEPPHPDPREVLERLDRMERRMARMERLLEELVRRRGR